MKERVHYSHSFQIHENAVTRISLIRAQHVYAKECSVQLHAYSCLSVPNRHRNECDWHSSSCIRNDRSSLLNIIIMHLSQSIYPKQHTVKTNLIKFIIFACIPSISIPCMHSCHFESAHHHVQYFLQRLKS